MIFERSGIISPGSLSGIALAVDPFVVVAHDERYVCVEVDILQDALADRGVFLHLSPLFEGQWPVLQEQARWQADLPDVVHQAAEVRPLLDVRRQAHSLRDVPRVDGDCLRVTCRVLIALLEGRNQSLGELTCSPA